jgi:hypothetical protein
MTGGRLSNEIATPQIYHAMGFVDNILFDFGIAG